MGCNCSTTFSGMIINYCVYPIHYIVYAQIEERSTQQSSSGIDTATSVGISTTGNESAKIAGLKDTTSQSLIYKQLKGFVEVKPNRRSTLGLDHIIQQRHTITIQIMNPNDPTKVIHHLVKDLIIMSQADVRLMILPDGTVATMNEATYKEELKQYQRQGFTKEEEKKRDKKWKDFRKGREREFKNAYYNSRPGMRPN